MKYDDASWHSGGDFPPDLPPEAGATHGGMFLAWAMLAGLAGEFHETESQDDLASLKSRTVTPGEFFLRVSDGKLTVEDLNEEGNNFARAYYEKGTYFEDYAGLFDDAIASIYHVPDSWETFAIVSPMLDARFDAWRRGA